MNSKLLERKTEKHEKHNYTRW